MDWNDQKYGEIWRQGWAAIANRYLEANDRPERLDLRSYERQGLDKIPTVHMGPAVSQMEKRGIQTNIGNLNRDITAANRLIFKRFYRSKHSLDTQGIGLGLPLAKSIIEGQNGVISVQSEVGKGTLFTLSFLTDL